MQYEASGVVAPFPMKPAEKVIVPTADFLRQWRKQISSLSNLDYSLNELGNALIEAVSDRGNVETELPLVVKHFLDQQVGGDYEIAKNALEQLFRSVCAMIDRIKIRENGEYLQYFFEGWYNDDMVLLYYPH